jgi:hypothetical protein
MKVRNVALTAAKFSVQVVGGAAMYPFLVVNGASMVVRTVASVAETASLVGIGAIVVGVNSLCDTLQSYRLVEEEIVESPLGDSAKSVN